jgi:hypothetical protein
LPLPPRFHFLTFGEKRFHLNQQPQPAYCKSANLQEGYSFVNELAARVEAHSACV